MSILTQIDRLTANVAAALAMIGQKGVTVPADATSDDLEYLISLIDARLEATSLTLNGAPGETITWSGQESGSTVLDSEGAATLDALEVGTYTFQGSVSGYSESVAVTKTTSEINVWPKGAIYWYGRFVQSGPLTAIAIKSENETYATGNPKSPAITVNTNDLYVVAGTGTKQAGTAYIPALALKAGTVDIVCTSTSWVSGRVMVFDSLTTGHSNTAYAGVGTGTKKTVSMTLDEDVTQYVGVELSTNASGTKSNITIYEIVNNY